MDTKPPLRFTPSCATPPAPVFEFRPMQGALAVCERVAKQFGLGHLWEGPDGLKAVAHQVLKQHGISDRPIPLTGPGGKLTPRGIAETAGLVKKTKRAKRCTG